MRWIELNKYNSEDTIFVNVELASSMERAKNDKFTMIWFAAGHADGQVQVQERPAEILDLIYDRPPC